MISHQLNSNPSFPKGGAINLGKLTNKILASPYGIVFDWRGEFNTEFLNPLRKMGPKLGVNISYSYLEPPRELAELTLKTNQGETKSTIEYEFNRIASFVEGVRNLEDASGQRLVFRVMANNHPSDTLCAAVLSANRWEQVRAAAGTAFHDIFFVRHAEFEPTLGVPMEIANAVLRSLEAGKKIEAVMHYKKHTGTSAFEAKDGVERLASLRSTIEALIF